jgi:hypothetical protein
MATIITRNTGGTAKNSPLTTTELDNNFINLNDDKYEAGDDIVVADFTATGDITVGITTGVAAAGNTQGTATSLTTTVNVVTSASANVTDGVILPAAVAGLYITVKNDTADNIKVYPPSSGIIDNESTNGAVTVPAEGSRSFVGVSTTKYNTVASTELAVYDSSGTRLN